MSERGDVPDGADVAHSASVNGNRRRTAVRPARDWLIVSVQPNCALPVRTNRRGVRHRAGPRRQRRQNGPYGLPRRRPLRGERHPHPGRWRRSWAAPGATAAAILVSTEPIRPQTAGIRLRGDAQRRRIFEAPAVFDAFRRLAEPQVDCAEVAEPPGLDV